MGVAMNLVAKLSKFLQYVLGLHPDEFGLVPDDQGFIKIKSLLQALNDDSEFRFVRQTHLNELRISVSPAVVDIQGHLIRAVDRSRLVRIGPPATLPKLLYTCIRRRAHPVVCTEGISPIGGLNHVLLSLNTEAAIRLGRRLDNLPVLLTVQVAASQAAGVAFLQFGDQLFLAHHIPVGSFSGPPLSKEETVVEKPEKTREPERPKTPGSFFPDFSSSDKMGSSIAKRHRRNEADWKKERRKARKDKQRDGW